MVRLEASRPATSEHAVVFTCDGPFARFAMMAARQIADRHPDRDFDICLCYDTSLPPEPAGLADLRIRFCRIDSGTLLDDLRLEPGRNRIVLMRLALPAAFAADYRRILYLDSDIFVQGGDFAALLDLDFGGHPVAAVRDNQQWRTPRRQPEAFRRLGLSGAYFNAGMLLIDVPRYEERDVLGRSVSLGRSHRAEMALSDQDLLNATLLEDWAELSPHWNWQYTWASRLFEAMEDANILHFIGPRKPWKIDAGEHPLRFRRAYGAFMERYYPDHPIAAGGMPAHRNPAFLRRMLLKHILAVGKTCAYLDRFPDDMTVCLPQRK